MAYIISYLFVGIFFGLCLLVHGLYKDDKKVLIFSTVVLIWPVIVFAAPDALLRRLDSTTSAKGSKGSEKRIVNDAIETTMHELPEVLEAHKDLLTEEEISSFENTLHFGISKQAEFGNYADFKDILEMFWERGIPPEAYTTYNDSNRKLGQSHDPTASPILTMRRAPDWYIGFSNGFAKSISKIDKKKQGRILEAIGQISSEPTKAIGNTIKPLTKELSGLWRYRIADDRLIYYPNIESKRVLLISFSPRGKAYENASDIKSQIT